MRAFFLCLMVVLAGILPSKAQQEDDTIMLLKVKPSVVLIYVYAKAELTLEGEKYPVELSGSGSGFIISPDGYVVTNGHVVQLYHESNEKLLKAQLIEKLIEEHGKDLPKEKKIAVFQALMNQPFSVEKKLYVIIQNGQAFPAELKAYSPPITPVSGRQAGKAYQEIFGLEVKAESGKDVAVLKIEAKNLPVAKLGNSDNVKLTDQIYAVGYPGVVLQHSLLGQQTILDPTVTSGRVSGAKVQVGGAPVIQTDAPLTWGNSGGPVFNRQGEVIGMATFISIKDTIPIQGFNFLVPSNTIAEFIRVSGANINQESVFNKLWYEAIDLYVKGEYEQAMKRLDDVLRLYPFLPDARNLQAKIQEKLTLGGGKATGGKAFLVLGGALLVILIAGGVGVFLFLKSKKPTPASKEKETKTLGQLVGLSGPYAGQTFNIPSTGIKIGRDPSKNNIVIKDDRVSREHAWIGPSGNSIVIRDLNSANGTFLNSIENKITEAVLKDGDKIIIGKGEFASFLFKG